MSGLAGAAAIATQALLVQQAALEAITNNIANINTPGYSRRRPVMVEEYASQENSLTAGRGVTLARFESLRDRVLELRLHDETQQQAAAEAYVSAMQQVGTLFSGIDQGLGEKMNALFETFSRLATDARSSPLREGVVTAGENLAAAFRATAAKLESISAKVDLEIERASQEADRLLSKIAELNEDVSKAMGLGTDTGALEDQRTQLIRDLSSLIDVGVVQNEDGLTLTTSKGEALVVGKHKYDLTSTLESDGARHITLSGVDVTSSIGGGKIGGLLQSRDSIREAKGSVDLLAFSLGSALNAANRAGTDAQGNPGGDLFVVGATVKGAAAQMRMAFDNPALIAASSDGTAGSNGNIDRLVGVRSDAVVAGETPVQFYAGLVFRIGSFVADAKANVKAGEATLSHLENQRDAISGVSLDEEAANLLRYQRAFQAAARVVSAVDEMMRIAVNLGRN